MPALASLSKNRLLSLSYLSNLRDRVLSSLRLSNGSSHFKPGTSQDSNKTSAHKHGINSDGTDGPQILGHGYAKMNEHFAFGEGPNTEVRSSPGTYDVELGEIHKSVSLQQLVTKSA